MNMLRKHAEDDPLCWHKWIPYTLLSYRSRIQSTTDYSPYELMFGKKMNHFEDVEKFQGGGES